MLHTLSRSSRQFDYQAFLDMLKADDAVLFIQDAVVIVIEHSVALSLLIEKNQHLYVLKEDVKARGLCDIIHSNVTLIDYKQFVDLTIQHTPQLAW